MTSDTKWFEGHQDEGLAAIAVPQLSDQATALRSSGNEEELAGHITPSSERSEGIVRPVLSAGYIPIQGTLSSSSGQPQDPQTFEAFENLERDLAELASACSGLDAGEPDSFEFVGPLPRNTGVSTGVSAITDDGAVTNLLDALLLPTPVQGIESNTADAAAILLASQPSSPISNEAPFAMNSQAQPANSETASSQVPVESAVSVRQSSALETDGVLHDVQSTLDSLAGMAQGLSQQKLDITKMREALEERRLATLERERQLAEREQRLSQQEQRLQEEKQCIERVAEHNAAVLAERSSALQALAETVDSRDRATIKRAEVLSQEQQSIDRQQNQLRARVQELDDREAGLQRQSGELADRFKQLLDAKERFGAIVKGFNETVRFNTTYSAISKTVATGADDA
ncbi:hypothetical protein P3W53_01580 [Pseudomonas denitrificans (nom. rej.)]|nr:hypothetical protein [Pseudomonas denitrificans (nom. rej.)]